MNTMLLRISLVMKHGSIVASQRVNGRVWNENIHTLPARKVQKPTIHNKTDAYRFLGPSGPHTGMLSGEGHKAEQYSINSEMLTDRLKPAIQSICQGILLKCVVLLHDNGRPTLLKFSGNLCLM
jgi:hypothetical protein